MSQARHRKRAAGGVAPTKVAGNPHVFEEADERKKGAKVRRKPVAAVEMVGGAVRQRLDRPRRGNRRGAGFAIGGATPAPSPITGFDDVTLPAHPWRLPQPGLRLPALRPFTGSELQRMWLAEQLMALQKTPEASPSWSDALRVGARAGFDAAARAVNNVSPLGIGAFEALFGAHKGAAYGQPRRTVPEVMDVPGRRFTALDQSPTTLATGGAARRARGGAAAARRKLVKS